MAMKEPRSLRPQSEISTTPFDSAEEAWFWFIQAQQAKDEGARVTMGTSLIPRPCEPADIMNVLYRLYRQRRLLMDHMLVLRHYGRRMLPPDPQRIKEGRAYRLWSEAMDRLDSALEHKGIVIRTSHFMEAAE